MLRILKRLVVFVFCVACFSAVLPATPVYACPAGTEQLISNDKVCCPEGSGGSEQSCLTAKYINPAILLLSAAAGVAVVIGIINGAIQISASGGDPQKYAKGKTAIVRALVGLVAFLFLYGGIQFMSPGGLASNPTPQGSGTVAQQCSKSFMGLKPWFAYLPDRAFESGTCNIEEFFFLAGKDANGDDQPSYLPPVLLAVADDLVRVAGLVAVAYVVVGGAHMIISQGDPERAKRGRETVLNALIGVVVAIAAAAVVSFVGNHLTQ
jgi:hypothetical protein